MHEPFADFFQTGVGNGFEDIDPERQKLRERRQQQQAVR